MVAARSNGQLDLRAKSTRAESLDVMRRLRRDGKRIADHFGLKYQSIRAERNDAHGHYGICYSDGRIRIRLRHARTGKVLRYSSLINTLCHELAHLKYFDHSDNFKMYYQKILNWARDQRIYQPKSVKTPKPLPEAVVLAKEPVGRERIVEILRGYKPWAEQLDLFGKK